MVLVSFRISGEHFPKFSEESIGILQHGFPERLQLFSHFIEKGIHCVSKVGLDSFKFLHLHGHGTSNAVDTTERKKIILDGILRIAHFGSHSSERELCSLSGFGSLDTELLQTFVLPGHRIKYSLNELIDGLSLGSGKVSHVDKLLAGRLDPTINQLDICFSPFLQGRWGVCCQLLKHLHGIIGLLLRLESIPKDRLVFGEFLACLVCLVMDILKPSDNLNGNESLGCHF